MPTSLPPLNRVQIRNLDKNLKHILKNKRRDTPIIIYCKKGIRAGIAKKLVMQHGFMNVTNLGGVEVDPLRRIIKME